MSDERLDQLERRVLALEALVRQLAAKAAAGAPTAPPLASPAPTPTSASSAPSSAPSSSPSSPPSRPSPSPTPAPASAPPRGAAPARPRVVPGLRSGTATNAAPRLDSETWLGQRGLLGVGVLSLLLAAGYFLKLAIDRGWISPVARCATGIVVGGAVAALGWRLAPRARRYGTALIGAGAGVMYLAVWAACRLYSLVPPTSGIGALALIAVSLAAIAVSLDAQPLALVAALGAFAAPLLLGRADGQADLLLVYTLTMALGLGAAATVREWRGTFAVLVIGAFVITAPVVSTATPLLLLAYATAIGTLAISVALRRGWSESRFVAFAAGWGLVFATASHLASPSPVLVTGILFAAPVWWNGYRQSDAWLATLFPATGPGAFPGELLYFCLLPFPLLHTITLQDRSYFVAHHGYQALMLAVPYLLVGIARPRATFAAVGTALLLGGLYRAVPGIMSVEALLGVVALWLLLDRLRPDTVQGRWLAMASWVVAVIRLLDGLDARPVGDPAFFGTWPVAMFATVVVGGFVARASRPRGRSVASVSAEATIWFAVGVLLLGSVTQEIDLAWTQSSVVRATAQLASGLSVSAWWLAAAAALIAAGFRRDRKVLRVAGLGVAVVAIIKVLVVDLAQLDALYRVASVAILAVVSLSLAWVYNRRARPDGIGAAGAANVDDPGAGG